MTTTGEARREPARLVLYAAVLLTAAATAWFVANLRAPHGPQVLGRIPGIFALTLAAVWLRRVAGTPGVPAVARRFWNQIALVTALNTVGMIVRACDSIRAHGTEQNLPVTSLVIVIVAMCGAVWALLRIPIGPRTPGDWIRLSLDGATVILGAGLFVWYVAFAPVLAGERGGLRDVWGPVVIGAMCLACLSAVVKIVLTGSGPVDPAALRMLGMGLLAGGVSSGTATIIMPTSNMVPGHLFLPVISLFIVLAGNRQRRAARQPSPRPRQRGRPYSLLPYAAVVATDALLVLATVGPADGRRHVVVAGAITITALVVVRQIVAFVDNARLVDQLREREDQLRHQASHDALTQLDNRDLLVERVIAALGA